jgi:hypothetical protein
MLLLVLVLTERVLSRKSFNPNDKAGAGIERE